MQVIKFDAPGEQLNDSYKIQFIEQPFDAQKLEGTVAFFNLKDMLKDAIIIAARTPNRFVPVVQAYFRGIPLGVDMALRVSNQACIQLTYINGKGEDSLAFETSSSPVEASLNAVNLLNNNLDADEASVLSGRNMLEVQFTTLDKVVNTLAAALDSPQLSQS